MRKILDFLSRKLKTDFRYIARGGFFLTLTQVTSAAVGMLLTVAFANLLPIETYGTYKYILSIYALAGILALPGIDTAVIQSVSRGFDGAFNQGVKIKMRWGLLGSAALFAYAAWIYVAGDPQLASLLAVAAAALPLMESLALGPSFFNAKKLYGTWTSLEIGTQIFSAASLATTVYLTDNIFLVIVAYFFPYVIARFVTFAIIRREFIENADIDPELAGYSKSLSLFQIASRAITSIDQIALYHFLGPAQVAIFSLAVAVPMRAMSVFRISGTLAFPKFANRSYEDAARALPQKLAIFAAGILVSCLAYVALAPYLFEYVFPKYLESLRYSQVIIFYTLSGVTYPFASLLFMNKKLRENYILSAVSLAIKIIALIVFVPLYGIWGAVISMLASSLAIVAVSLYFTIAAARQGRA